MTADREDSGFAETLKGARVAAKLTIADLAKLTNTPPSALASFETRRATPSVTAAAHLLAALDLHYVALRVDKPGRARIDSDAIAPLETWIPDRPAVIASGRQGLAVLVHTDVTAERLNVTFDQVKTLVSGTTITGDPWSVWRTRELLASARAALDGIARGIEPGLRTCVHDNLVAASKQIAGIPLRSMDFLVRATRDGADPAYVRHLCGAYLAFHGYPWLFVPHRLGSDYRRALVACRRFGDGTGLVRVLTASIDRSA